MITQKEISAYIIKYLKDKIPMLKDAVISGGEHFDNRELYFDSIEFIGLIVDLEERYGVEIFSHVSSPETVTINGLSAIIAEKTDGR